MKRVFTLDSSGEIIAHPPGSIVLSSEQAETIRDGIRCLIPTHTSRNAYEDRLAEIGEAVLKLVAEIKP